MREAFVTAGRVVGPHWRTWLRTAVALQVLTLALAGPVIALLLRAALSAAGVPALTEASLGQVLRHPVAVALLLLLAAVATAAVLVQHAAFVLLARELAAGRVPLPRQLLAAGLAASRRLAGPGLVLVALYAFVVAPLGSFTLGATVTRGIELPPFIAGELRKSTAGTVVWLVAGLTVLWLNLRLVFVPTLLLTRPVGPAEAFAGSWRLTRRRSVPLGAAALALWGATAVVGGGLVMLAVWLTRVSDILVPAVSQAVAGLALATVQGALLLWSGLVTALVSTVLVVIATDGTPAPDVPVAPAQTSDRWWSAVAVIVLLSAAWANGVALSDAGSGRTTAVVAHRGDTYGAVENTIESLEAAAALGADLVELDVLQAQDGGLVVFHDTTLRRLAGESRNVFEMSTAELTATTIRQGGHTSTIPTFAAFAARAAELDVSLLVEVKSHGREQGDLLGDVVAVLEDNGLVGTALVQAFDRGSVAELEARFPQVSSGWVVAFSRGRLDPGAADFVTMEQSSYTPDLLRQAHTAGVRVLLWTVTDPVRMRSFIREGVDGLITTYPRRALEQRAAVLAETGMADRLEDTLRSLADL